MDYKQNLNLQVPCHLDSSAVNQNYNCRFCLKIFEEDEKQITLSHFIRNQFHVITQRELKSSQAFSQNICEFCFDNVRDFARLKTKLIENQEKLEELLKPIKEDFVEVEPEEAIEEVELEIPVETSSLDSVLLKVEKIEESEEVYEEYLESDMIEENLEFDETGEGEKLQKANRMKLCSECGKSYASYAFKRHFERVHLRLKNYHCDFCDYKSYSRNHIEIHLKSHLKIKTFYCEQCGAAFGNGNILRQHKLTHQEDRPFKCEQPECFLSFKSIYALRRHNKTHSKSKYRFECEECGAKFSDSWHLKRHSSSHQSQSHPCSSCEKVFGTLDRLKAHQIYHKPPQFSCGICQKEYYKKPDLNTHLKTHTGEKDFQCSACPNSYFKKAHLDRHFKTSHLMTKLE